MRRTMKHGKRPTVRQKKFLQQMGLNANAYFESEKAAQQAIDIVGKDDLIWLFRDFQPYVEAYKEKADD